jgi:hypothetical protein
MSEKSEKRAQNIGTFLATAGIVGGVGAVTVVTTNWLLNKTSLTDVSKAFAQTTSHLVLGTAVGMLGAPRVGAGIAAGGIIGGAAKLEQEVRVRAYIRSLVEPRRAQAGTQQTPAQNQAAQVGAGTQPAGRAYADESAEYVGRG